MLTFPGVKERFQVDWLISNLRWLLLVSVALVSFLDALIDHSGAFDAMLLFPPIVLLGAAALYNIAVMMLLYHGNPPPIMPVMTLLIDTILTISFVIFSGGLTSPLLFFTLFPIVTAALRFPWTISVLIAIAIVVISGFFGYLLAPAETLAMTMLPFAARSLVLLLAALISGLIGDRVKQAVAHARRLQQENELRRLRTTQEHLRAIFELASVLSATLNYNKVLETVLDVGEAGMRELGRPDPAYVGMVLLFSRHNDLRIMASRHLPRRDQSTIFEGKSGALAQALKMAEPVIADNPGADPELCHLVMMHNCKQAIVVPLRAGFESFGAVVFGSPHPNTYTPDHENLLTAICNQATVALQNAQLYQSLMEEKERIVMVEEDARKKLARDLHDGPTQSITAIAMRLNYMRMLLEGGSDTRQIVEELGLIEELAHKTTKEIRHMLFTLRPLILETRGLRAALEHYITKLAETDPTPIHLEAPPAVDQALDKNVQGAVFYIIEEAIGNARKHARPQNIWVRLNIQDQTFIAEVEDDGRGFDVDKVQACYEERGSLGMINMHERAELVGGRLAIVSSPGKGTRITLVVPLRGR